MTHNPTTAKANSHPNHHLLNPSYFPKLLRLIQTLSQTETETKQSSFAVSISTLKILHQPQNHESGQNLDSFPRPRHFETKPTSTFAIAPETTIHPLIPPLIPSWPITTKAPKQESQCSKTGPASSLATFFPAEAAAHTENRPVSWQSWVQLPTRLTIVINSTKCKM